MHQLHLLFPVESITSVKLLFSDIGGNLGLASLSHWRYVDGFSFTLLASIASELSVPQRKKENFLLVDHRHRVCREEEGLLLYHVRNHPQIVVFKKSMLPLPTDPV